MSPRLIRFLRWAGLSQDAGGAVPLPAPPGTVRKVVVNYETRDICVDGRHFYHLCLPDPQDPNCWALHSEKPGGGVGFVFTPEPTRDPDYNLRVAVAEAVAKLLRYRPDDMY